MIIKSVNLETVCGITSKLPENEFSEFAFAGKSNVGKSSLINGLISRKAYALPSAGRLSSQSLYFWDSATAIWSQRLLRELVLCPLTQ